MNYQINIPTRIIEDKEITDASIRLFLFIAKGGAKRGYIWHSNESLSNSLGMHKRAISKLLLKLEENGYITRVDNVKPNRLYDKAHKRVIWLRDAYLMAKDAIKVEAKKKNSIAKFIKERRAWHMEHTGHIPVYIGDNALLAINDRGRMVNLFIDKEVDQETEHTVWGLYYEAHTAQNADF